MTATLVSRDGQTKLAELALAVADANWFTTENLFRELRRETVATLLLSCMDVRNAWRRGTPISSWRGKLARRGDRLWQHDLVLPSGWMKLYPRVGMRPIASAIRRWRATFVPDSRLALVMTYPHYLFLRDLVRPDHHIYYNIDDYTLYWPHHADRIRALERQAAREADVTVCVSQLRAEELRVEVPEAAHKIRHLPHGAPSGMIPERACARPAPAPEDIASLQRPLLGYVGSLEDRVDWDLLSRLSADLPRASIVLVGRTGAPGSEAWHQARMRCLARPNVHVLGWRPQESIHLYNRAFDVCLIPYATDHAFNRVCCPTKIMDYMGSGRPIVSTDLPECRLCTDLFHVTAGADAFVAAVQSILDAGSDDGRAERRFEWARDHSCERVAERLLDWLNA
jgi:glycosyltransferase involved in cell wall biosynthesis